MRAPMTLDIFSFAFLFMCYYWGLRCKKKKGMDQRKTEKFTKEKVIRKIWFQHDERKKMMTPKIFLMILRSKARADTT